MVQVCFTACFAEEGKGTSAGYSIFYYARANARASDSCEKSTRKQESRRFSISGKGRKGEKVPVWLKETRRAPAQDWQKKTLREPQNTGMADKKTASSIVKRKRFRIKIGMTEEKHGKSLHKTDRKKCFRNRKIPEWLIKKRQAASAKCERFQMKNQDYGEKTQQAPAQNRQKKCSENWKMPK